MITQALPSVVYNEDCVEALKRFSDNHFDLAIVDPPYGIGEDGLKNHSRNQLAQATKYTPKNWDRKAPDKEYFDELMRVSKNQIVWGGNYFGLPASNCWLVWNKKNGENLYADCELAWTSLNTAVRKFKWRWNGMLQQNMKDKEVRIHPTQKPVALYDWILEQFGSDANLILDTHVGSGSSRIACNKAGKQFVGFEIDKDYYEAQEKRFKDFVSQLRMF